MKKDDVYVSKVCGLCEKLVGSDSMDNLLQTLVGECAKTMQAKACSVRLLDEKRKTLLIGAAFGLSKEYLEKGPVDIDQSPLDKDVIDGITIEIYDIQKDPRVLYPKEMAKEGIRSTLCLPLRVRGKAIGVLRVYTGALHKFSEKEKKIAETLASQGGASIDRIKLKDEMEAMVEIARKVSSSLNVKEVLDSVVESAAKTLGFKAASIRLFDEDQKKLEIKATYGLSEEYLKKGPVEIEKSPIDREIMACSPFSVTDVEENGHLQYPEEVKKEGIRTILCLPMMIKGKVIGVLRVYTSVPYKFEKREIEFLSALSNQAAIATENARLFEHLKRDYEDLTRDVWKWYDWGVREPVI